MTVSKIIRHMFCAITLGGGALALSGCSSMETHVSSRGAGLQGTPTLMWATLPEDMERNPHHIKLHMVVGDSLSKRGLIVSENGAVILSAGLSERPAAIHVEDKENAVYAPAKRRRLFQHCGDTMLRLTVTMVDGASGKLLYNGSAQEPYCNKASGDGSVQTALLNRLAERAVEDLKTPQGERLITNRK